MDAVILENSKRAYLSGTVNAWNAAYGNGTVTASVKAALGLPDKFTATYCCVTCRSYFIEKICRHQ